MHFVSISPSALLVRISLVMHVVCSFFLPSRILLCKHP